MPKVFYWVPTGRFSKSAIDCTAKLFSYILMKVGYFKTNRVLPSLRKGITSVFKSKSKRYLYNAESEDIYRDIILRIIEQCLSLLSPYQIVYLGILPKTYLTKPNTGDRNG